MTLPTVHIVDNPAIAQPKIGYFIRLVMKTEKVSMLDYLVWSAQTQSIVGGQLFPGDQEFKVNMRTEELLAYLAKWSTAHVMNTHLYMTKDAALLLLPEMCRPRVPFALAKANLEIRIACVTELTNSLKFN